MLFYLSFSLHHSILSPFLPKHTYAIQAPPMRLHLFSPPFLRPRSVHQASPPHPTSLSLWKKIRVTASMWYPGESIAMWEERNRCWVKNSLAPRENLVVEANCSTGTGLTSVIALIILKPQRRVYTPLEPKEASPIQILLAAPLLPFKPPFLAVPSLMPWSFLFLSYFVPFGRWLTAISPHIITKPLTFHSAGPPFRHWCLLVISS